MKVDFAFLKEIQNTRCLKSSVKFPQSVILGATASAGVGGGGWATVFYYIQS